MAARKAEPPYTKGQVDRAGRLLLQGRQRAEQAGALEAMEELDGQPVTDAVDALWWWRGLYARPLSNTAARLRYHVGGEGGEIRGRIEVAQRLKRRGGGDAALRAAFRDMAESLAGWDREEAVAPGLREALESLRFSRRSPRPRTSR